MHIDYEHYKENRTHRCKRIVWAITNKFIFPILPKKARLSVLRLFGAEIGSGEVFRTAKIYAPWNLKMGQWACIGPRVVIYNKAPVVIGSYIVISQDSYLCTASHDISSPCMAPINKPIVIHDNAWIAARVVILPGVTIGEGAVVGCAAVVVKDVSPWSVVGGNPAVFLKERTIKEMQ